MILGSGLIQASGWPQASDWLIRDEFTDTRAAGSVNGTAAQPGPGTRAVVDTDGDALSVGSGVMSYANPNNTVGDPGIRYGAITSAPGSAFAVKYANPTTGLSYIGFDTNAFGLIDYGVRLTGGEIQLFLSPFTKLGDAPSGSAATLVAILFNGRIAFFQNVSGVWKFLYIQSGPNNGTSLYPTAINYNSTATIDYLRAIALPAPFDTDDGLATDTHSGAVSAGTTFTHEADVWMEFVATTVPSGDSIDVQFRKIDSLNYWICRINSSGDISLEEVVDGSETQRGLAVGVVSNGHRVVIIADDESIRVLSNNTSRISYGSAASAKTATAGEVDALGTGGAVSNLYTWPRALNETAATTQAASILNKVSA